MKLKTTLIVCVLFMGFTHAQNNLSNLLSAGLDDARTYLNSYIESGGDGLVYGINNNWYNSASVGDRFSVELSIVGNLTFFEEDDETFVLDVSDYNNVRFPNNAQSQRVNGLLSKSSDSQSVIITYESEVFGTQEFEVNLPEGFIPESIDFIPTAYLQAGFNPFSHTQVKARFLPKIKADDVEASILGFGVQHEFTKWIPTAKSWPVAISALVGYTHLNSEYDLEQRGLVRGENDRIEVDVNTFTAQLIAGTKFKWFNFYGGFGLIDGSTELDVLGRYTVRYNEFETEEFVDPFAIKTEETAVIGHLGANVKLGFFRLNATYDISNFNSLSFGLNFKLN